VQGNVDCPQQILSVKQGNHCKKIDVFWDAANSKKSKVSALYTERRWQRVGWTTRTGEWQDRK
jgi:hypothetical protein